MAIETEWCIQVGGSGRWAAPAVVSCLERQGRGLRFFPRSLAAHAHPKWIVSRVLFRPPVTWRAGEDHSSRRRIAAPLERSHPDAGAAPCGVAASGGPPSTASLFELAPGGACPAAGHPAVARGLLPHDFNLACASQRTAKVRRSPAIGGLVSVALSLGSPRVAVSDLPTLWSPDFPPADGGCPPAILHPPLAAIGYPAAHGRGKRVPRGDFAPGTGALGFA